MTNKPMLSDSFHIYYEKNRIWEKTTWLGVPILTLPFDIFIIQELIFKIQPDYIIETGTGFGGSALFYASIMKLIEHGQVITVDKVQKSSLDNWTTKQIRDDLVLEITGDSIDSRVVKIIKDMVKDKKNMVILDSWHTKGHVLKELEAYNEMVSCGSYLIVQDTHVNGHPVPWQWGEGPYEAVEEFLKNHSEFEIDKDCEKFEFTFHPNGYLRKTR